MSEANDVQSYKKVFVTLDGTPAQDKVFKRAIASAASNHATLYVGHVIDSTALETTGVYPVEIIPSLEAAFLESIEDLLKTAQNCEDIPEVVLCIKTGRIRETIMEEMIKPIEPELIVCGARGLSSIKYALLGSISTFLLRNAPCDILVVK